MQILDISFDKMTVLGDLSSNQKSAFQSLLDHENILLYENGFHDVAKGMIFGKVYFEYDRLKGQAYNSRNFRMEFNPNKLDTDEVIWIIDNIVPLLSDVGFTRLDLAFDVDFDLSEYKFIPMGKERNKRKGTFQGATGRIETIYIGARSSDKMVRIYNKKLERKDKDLVGDYSDLEHWWRLEFELKRESVNDFDVVLETLKIINPNYNSLSFKDASALFYLLENPNGFSVVAKKTREKYMKLLKEMNDEDITHLFKEALDNKKSDLHKQIADWLEKQYSVFAN